MASRDAVVPQNHSRNDSKRSPFLRAKCEEIFKFRDEFTVHVSTRYKMQYCDRDGFVESEVYSMQLPKPKLESGRGYDFGCFESFDHVDHNVTSNTAQHSFADQESTNHDCDNDDSYDIKLPFNFVACIKQEPVEENEVLISERTDDFTEVTDGELGENYINEPIKLEPHEDYEVPGEFFTEQNIEKMKYEELLIKQDLFDISHAGKKINMCVVCGKSFKQIHVLRTHLLVHTEERPFSCVECGKAFKCKKGLTQHSLTHSDNKPHFCKEHKKGFKCKGALEKHMQRHKHNEEKCKPSEKHKNGDERCFSCEKCGKMFKTKYEVDRHLQRHSIERPYRCAECNKGFKNKQDLTRHLLIHVNSKPHSCDECEKRFISRSKLKRHKLSHGNERRYRCKECGKAFKMNSVLQTHLFTHCKEKQFGCGTCRKKFKSRRGLLGHLRCHDKIYVCDECGRSFKTEVEFRTHEKTHAENRPYFCKLCGKMFLYQTNLYAHMLTHANSKHTPCNKCKKALRHKKDFRNCQMCMCQSNNNELIYVKQVKEENSD